ncbi:MAG: hypothetical protein QXJ75_04005 [Candidatus Bathyarchaeia archaeon]
MAGSAMDTFETFKGLLFSLSVIDLLLVVIYLLTGPGTVGEKVKKSHLKSVSKVFK